MNAQFQIQLHYGSVTETILSTRKRIERYKTCKGSNNLSVIQRIYALEELKKELMINGIRHSI